MEMTWTKEQSDAIRLRDRNILVSAAAGSGKTAVLVERILKIITDEDRPVDIDRLLVVTFTRAAAGEMKERIQAALEAELEKDPDKSRLVRQLSFIHNANITTIDGFCAWVVRNYYYLIGLDPGYRIADDGERKLLKSDTVKEVLEEAYREGDQNFLDFVEAYAPGKTDKSLEERILELFEAAQSHPWPEEWLEYCRERAERNTKEEIFSSPWMVEFQEDASSRIRSCLDLAEKAMALCQAAGGPDHYIPAIQDDLDFLQELEEAATYEKRFDLLCAHGKWTALSRKKMQGDMELKDQVMKIRNQMKDLVKELKEEVFFLSPKEIIRTGELCKPMMTCLVDLTRQFSQLFRENKKKKNLLDFSDLEHLTLDILISKENGQMIRSQAARELSCLFAEIMIDEYQDSNMVQDLILRSVSRMDEGENNIFMVGDVKQSIYRFRLARPELFVEKYRTYGKEEGAEQRIDLHQNFRSRAEVLDAVNQIFYRIMCKELGGIAYDKAAALHLGASYLPAEKRTSEILLLEKRQDPTAPPMQASQKEAEARLVGQRIRELMKEMKVMDKASGLQRDLRFSDCVILFRSLAGSDQIYSRVLTGMGIPCHVTSQSGYFSSMEVVTILNFLQILDNPRQDLPFAAVLHSPLVGLDAAGLAEIRSAYPEGCLYQACRDFSAEEREDGGEKASGEKRGGVQGLLSKFFAMFDELRDMVPDTPIHLLLRRIFDKSGYEDFVSAMAGGEVRRANLRMLEMRARSYGETSFRGLFNFVRYIEELKKHEIDYGEANILGDDQDLVRIMTIHKSKGLEFPVVFLAESHKKFNLRDLNAPVLVHPDLGAAMDCIDPLARTKCPTLYKKVIRRKLLLESLGEEMRILYVAMTRAKEKLIMAGSILDRKLEEVREVCREKGKDGRLPLELLEKGRSFLDWLLPASGLENGDLVIDIRRADDLLYEESKDVIDREMARFRLEHWQEKEGDKGWIKELEERFSYTYPYAYLADLPGKVSVSELKKQAMEEDYSKELFPNEETGSKIPRFIKDGEEESLGGADRGTAYHRIFELLSYKCPLTREGVEEELEGLLTKKRIDKKTYQAVEVEDVLNFLKSPLGRRMGQAAGKGMLKREQPFTMSIPAADLSPAYGGEEEILVQGIIDAFFYEEDSLILVDYKTDRIRTGGQLAGRYKKQLDYYAQALERSTGKKVVEKLLYSVTLGEIVAL